MIKFCSLPAQGMWLWGIKPEEQYYLHVYGLKYCPHWLEDPEQGENGWLKPYIYDAFLKFSSKWSASILPHEYGYEHAVITFLTQHPVTGVQSWDFKRILNIYVDVPEAPDFHYLHIARIYQSWATIDIIYEDGRKEIIDMEIFRPYRTTKPIPPEKKVDTVKVLPTSVNKLKTRDLQEV